MIHKTSGRLAANFGLSLTYSLIEIVLLCLCVMPFLDTVKTVFGVPSGYSSADSTVINNIYVPKSDEQVIIDNSGKEQVVEVIPETVPLSDVVMPKYGECYARMIIDSVGITQDVYMGDSLALLKLGVGQYFGSSIPGYGKKIIMAGHNTAPYLYNLKDIKKGDIIKIGTSYGNYKYEIYDMKVSPATDATAYNFDVDEETLILYTCYPFTLGYKSDRLFIYAHKISGPDIVKG